MSSNQLSEIHRMATVANCADVGPPWAMPRDGRPSLRAASPGLSRHNLPPLRLPKASHTSSDDEQGTPTEATSDPTPSINTDPAGPATAPAAASTTTTTAFVSSPDPSPTPPPENPLGDEPPPATPLDGPGEPIIPVPTPRTPPSPEIPSARDRTGPRLAETPGSAAWPSPAHAHVYEWSNHPAAIMSPPLNVGLPKAEPPPVPAVPAMSSVVHPVQTHTSVADPPPDSPSTASRSSSRDPSPPPIEPVVRLPLDQTNVGNWTPPMVCEWATECLGNWFDPKEVEAPLQHIRGQILHHWVDGEMLLDGISSDTWDDLVPQWGLRAVLEEGATALATRAAAPPTAPPTAPPSAPQTPSLGVGLGVLGGQSSVLASSMRRPRLPHPPSFHPRRSHQTIRTPRTRDAFARSRFSNTPLLDGPYPADPSRSCFQQFWGRLSWDCLKVIFYVKTVIQLFTWMECLVVASYLGVALVCDWRDFRINFHPSLYVTPVIFPLAFSVQSAYQRREDALHYLANLKAVTFATYLCHKGWDDGVPNTLDSGKVLGDVVTELFVDVREYLQSLDENDKSETLQRIYLRMSEIHILNESLRRRGVIPGPFMSRTVQDLRGIMDAFENLRVIADYRTPSSIRVFTAVSIIAGAFVFGPYLAFLQSFSRYALYDGALAISLLFSALHTVQRMLENPFNSPGLSDQDDINLDFLRSIDSVKDEHRGWTPSPSGTPSMREGL